jgi:hypothetical protein
MAILELVRTRPDWTGALGVALTRPPGIPERRAGEDPWNPDAAERPRRISDDLAWFRCAVEEHEGGGLVPLEGTATVGAWEADEVDTVRLARLRDRGVLDAAGFLLHAPDEDLDLADVS